MEFKEILNVKKEDIRNFNFYLASLNKNLGMVFAGSVIAVLGIIGLFTGGKENLVLNILTIILGIIGLIYPMFFNKVIFKSKVNKIDFEDLEPVEITLNDEGINYIYVSEIEQGSFPPYKWRDILRAVEKDKYLYIHLADRRSILIITLNDIKNPEFVEFIKSKLVPLKRYLVKIKK